MVNIVVGIIILLVWLIILGITSTKFLVMVVEEMNILTTMFLRFDNQKVLYPNSILWTKSNGNYYRTPMIVFKDMESVNSARIAVWPTHRMNHQDMGERWARRPQLVEEIAKICRELDIEHRLYPLDISVKTMPSPTGLPVYERLPPHWSAPASGSK
ncbi:hypothetical protein Bca52824_053296 [Brassica carinata]|uniref:Uncharacterized protein n=1 Tax=Brassica carinata TaxID=52824 RepID=A0A8X7ULK8_BRACI|nr:hypothetical protein Bca52824_053296 [Brassica carinata]